MPEGREARFPDELDAGTVVPKHMVRGSAEGYFGKTASAKLRPWTFVLGQKEGPAAWESVGRGPTSLLRSYF